jgi:hypothetical protein
MFREVYRELSRWKYQYRWLVVRAAVRHRGNPFFGLFCLFSPAAVPSYSTAIFDRARYFIPYGICNRDIYVRSPYTAANISDFVRQRWALSFRSSAHPLAAFAH